MPIRTKPNAAMGAASEDVPTRIAARQKIQKPPAKQRPNDKTAAIRSNIFIVVNGLTLYHKVKDRDDSFPFKDFLFGFVLSHNLLQQIDVFSERLAP
jgi:hypothetical protein